MMFLCTIIGKGTLPDSVRLSDRLIGRNANRLSGYFCGHCCQIIFIFFYKKFEKEVLPNLCKNFAVVCHCPLISNMAVKEVFSKVPIKDDWWIKMTICVISYSTSL